MPKDEMRDESVSEESKASGDEPVREDGPEPAAAVSPEAVDGLGSEDPVEAGQSQTVASEADPADSAADRPPRHMGTGIWAGIAVVALIVGILVGVFAGGGTASSGDLTGKTTVPASQLDTAIATYTSNGKSTDITIREVIQQQSSLDAAIGADGNYQVPSADAVISVARNMIIMAEAQNRGIAATDEEVAAYAEETLGSSDYASIGASYSMDEEDVVKLLTESCVMSKLREEVVGASDDLEAPAVPPEAPEGEATDEESEDGASVSDEPTKAYADYIIGLAGDEWDAAADTWASADGPYATALASYDISAEGATYEAATQAYYVAYQLYAEQSSAVSDTWTEFVNGLMSNATITVYTLLA